MLVICIQYLTLNDIMFSIILVVVLVVQFYFISFSGHKHRGLLNYSNQACISYTQETGCITGYVLEIGLVGYSGTFHCAIQVLVDAKDIQCRKRS